MGSYYMEATQINYRRDETVKTVDQKLQELSEESAVDTDIAPLFSKTSTYNPGDLVYYKNKLYVCNTQHTGAWAAADFTATTVSAAMTASSASLDASKADYTDLAPAFDAESSYVAGDLVTYSGTVYRCTNDHTGAWDADDFSATTIGAEINSISSNLSKKTTIISETNAIGNAYNIAGVICLAIYDGGQFSCNANDVIFTLPVGFRPSVEVQVVNTASGHERILINSSGQVIAKDAFSSSYARFTITYM